MTDPAPPLSDLPPEPGPGEIRAARRAVAMMLGAALLALLGLSGVALWLGPPEGDLVRISGGSQRLFGARAGQEGLARRYRRDVTLGALRRGADPGDLLVFGDSFSIAQSHGEGWINRLGALTGLRPRRVTIGEFDVVTAYLASPGFRDRPPRAILVETVERSFARRARALAGPGCATVAPPQPLEGLAPRPPAPLAFTHRQSFEGVEEMLSWGALALRLRLGGGGPVREVGLRRADLFTHRLPGRLLLLEDDMARHLPEAYGPGGPDRARAEIACGLQRLAEMAGEVPLWVVVAPDKREIYGPWIADPLPKKALDLYAVAEAALGARFIDLRAPMRAAVEAGVRDLYWPSDTHWSATGHRLAAETVAQALTR